MTLLQAFDAAWERQPERQSEAWRRDAAAAGVEAAQRWTPEPPVLEASAKSDRWARNDGAREYDAALAVPLWWPGERSRAQAAAAAEAGAVDARLQAARWRFAGEVREAWWMVRRMRLDHQFAQQRLAGARQLAADVARRLRAGDLARSDNHQAEAAVADAESALAEANAALLQAEAAWSALTGQMAGADELAPEPVPADTTLADRHPALQEQAAKVALARQARELAGVQTRGNPELTVGTAHERGGFGERYGQSVVIGVRIPLGRSSGSSARQATANAELLEAEAQLRLEQERLRRQAEAARAQVGALGQARDAAERRATLARESRGFIEKSFGLGESDLPTRLRADHEAFEAERQAARRRIEHDAAVSQWRQALGLLPQ